jgi:hypothetical protein
MPMQDRYVGDVGDFGKYGLLRSLAAGLPLGVVWYLTPDESHNADGNNVAYLNPTSLNLAEYGDCDLDLYTTLRGIVHGGERFVTSVREREVLPRDTVFYEDRLTFKGMPANSPSTISARRAHRSEWVDRALEATQECNIVFLDPNNGVQVLTTQSHEKYGPRYVYFDEVQPYLDRGQSVIVYQNRDHSKVPEQMRRVCAGLRGRLQKRGEIIALFYGPGSGRSFIVIPAADHETNLARRIGRFMQSPWSRHVSDVTPPAGQPVTHFAEGTSSLLASVAVR